MVADGWKLGGLNAKLIQGVLNIGFTAFVIGSMVVILAQALTRWLRIGPPRAVSVPIAD